MTHLTRLFKQDYKKAHKLEDIFNWTTGVEEVLDDNGDIEVDRVPADVNFVAAIEALDFALSERYALYKLDPVSEAHANRRQAVKKNFFTLTNMALETALLAVFQPCLALPAWLAATNSASEVGKDTLSCRRLFQEICPPFIMRIYPVWDWRVSVSPNCIEFTGQGY